MREISLVSSLGRAADRLALPPSAVEAIGRWLITLAAVGALLLPAAGPLLDHHFVERQPSHSHVFLDQSPHDHLHSYEYAAHNHEEHDPPLDGIVVVTSYDAMGSGFTDVTPPIHRLARLLPARVPEKAVFGFDAERKLLAGESISPPTQPPRL